MSDIAKFGIEVDPKGAVVGSQKAKKATRGVGDEASRTQRKVTNSNRSTGRSTQNMARQSRGAFSAMSQSAINMLGSFGLLNNGFGQLIQQGQLVSSAGKQMAGGLKGTSGAAISVAASAGGAAAAFRGMAAAAGGALVAIGPLLLILGGIAAALIAVVVAVKAASFAFGLLKQGVSIAADMEQTRVAVEVLVGSTTKAVKVLQEMKDLSDSTPLSPKAVQDAGRSLLAFGSSTETVVGELRRIGDVALGVQAPIGEIATLYGKARVQGTLFAEDINQLTNRGIPILEIFASQLGVGVDQVKKMGSEGKITFDNLERAFVTLTDEGGQFSGMMERMSQTFSGRVSTMSGLWDSLLAAMGEPIKDALAPLLDDLIWLIREATPVAARFGQMIGSAIKILYQSLSDGKFTKLLELALLAGFEAGVSGFWTMMKGVMVKIGALLVTTFEFSANALKEALITAFTDSANVFKQLIPGHFLIKKIAEARHASQQDDKARAAAGLPPKQGLSMKDLIPGHFVARKFGEAKASGAPVENLIPGVPALKFIKEVANGIGNAENREIDTRSFEKMLKDNMSSMGAGIDGIFGVVPTGNRDEFDSFAKDILVNFNKDNPGLPPIERPPLPTKLPTETADPVELTKKNKIINQLSEQTKGLLQDFGNLQLAIDTVTAGTIVSFANGFSDAFSSIALGTATVGEAFSKMAGQIISDITRMIIKMTIQLAIQKALGGAAGGGIGGGFGGMLISAISGQPTGLPVKYSGDGTPGGIPKVGNKGLATFHAGGVTGSEAAVKVDRNETILTRKRSDELEMKLSNKRESAGQSKEDSRPIQLLNITDPSMISDAIAANPDMIVNAISRRMPAVRNMIVNNRRR